MATTRVLVDVDIQNDFCLSTGALSVKGSPNDLYRRITKFALAQSLPIVGSVDSHAYDAWEFASNKNLGPNGEKPNFPDHCVKGTSGWLKVDGTLAERFRFVPCVENAPAEALAAELASGATQALYFEKEVYSLFANPSAAAVLEALKKQREDLEFIVYGVATDYCVRAAALGLREKGYATTVLVDAIRGITDEGTAKAFEEIANAGASLASTTEVFGAAFGA